MQGSARNKMPSLQQINLKDCPNPDLERNFTGSDILYKHSINSLLEQNSDIINRGLASPNEGKASISSFDMFGSNSGNNNQSAYYAALQSNNSFSSTQSSGGSSSGFLSSPQSHQTNNSSHMASPTTITTNHSANNHNSISSSSSATATTTKSAAPQQQMTNNNQIMASNTNGTSCNGNHNNQMQSTKAADFQFQNRSFAGNNNANNSNALGKTRNSQQLKMSRNHLTLDCTPASPRNFAASPLFGNSFNSFDSGFSANSMPSPYNNQYHNLSASPLPDYASNTESGSNVFSGLENHNLLDLMNCLNLNQSSNSIPSFFQHIQQQQNQQNSTPFGSVGSGGSGCTSPMSPNDYDMARMQNLNTLRLLQQQQQRHQQQQTQLSPLHGFNSISLNHLMNNGYQYKNWQLPQTAHIPSSPSEVGLDRYAKFHRSSAALNDPSCTWSGVLPIRSHRLMTYSPKVFLGGTPWDISEQSLVQIFKQFGPIRVEWPGKDQQASQPKGYAYIIFESEKQVKAMLQACNQSDYNSSSGSIPNTISSNSGKYYFKISTKRIKAKEVEVIPWVIADSNYVKAPSQKLDPTLTVFVGALHGKLTAEGLAKVMNDLFEGVVYAGIDTDKYKYPIGSGRVTFNNTRSYMKAVSAAFIEIKTSKFTKKVQVDPYLEDSLCSSCGVQHGPYYCRELVCFRYFCRTCWALQHNNDPAICNHKPLTRNSKSTHIIGVGPQSVNNTQTTPTTPNGLMNNPFSP